MKIRTIFLALVVCFSTTFLFCEEESSDATTTNTDVKKKFTEENAKVIKEETTEDVRATIRVPDTNAFMGRKKTEISDDYRNFLIQKLVKSNKKLYK
jgi:hypothetical protein